VLLFEHGVPDNESLKGIGVSEPVNIDAVCAEYVVENVFSVS
jgi:hypothetical protein